MNKYSSVERRFWARNVAEKTIIPPADLAVLTTDWVTQAVRRPLLIDYNTNLTVKRIGIFSNFADGLVFKNASESLCLSIGIEGTQDTSITGVASATAGSKAVTGAGTAFVAEFAPGDYIRFGSLPDQSFVGIIDTVTDNTNMVLRDYAPHSYTSTVKMVSLGGDTYREMEFRTLNDMYDVDEFLLPVNYATASADGIVITANVGGPTDTTITFLTKSVNTDFANDACNFDVGIDIEYTKNPNI